MAEKPSEIMGEIEGYRERLGQDLSDLHSRVRESTDWRTYYEKYPLWFVGGALGGGILLSGLLFGKSDNRQRFSRRFEVANSVSNHEGGQKTAISEVVENVRSAVVGFGIAKAKEVLADVLPGFQEHQRRAQKA